MKSIRKRFVAIILLAVMVFSDFQMSTSLAMDNSSAVEETEVAETDAANTVKAENRLNYILVESPYLESPNTQNIVVSWGDGTEQISNMRITVQKEDGSTEEWTCSNQSGYLYVFSKEYVDESEQSTYKVIDIRFEENQQEQCFLLTDLNVEAEFGVNKAYDGIEELQPLDPEDAVETSIVTIDENGETEAQDNIASALTAVSEEMGAAAGIRSAEKAGEIVVALDPGHDNRHGGTSGSGLTEQELTLKIAKYAKAELETYNGVKVYMTRTTAACPYPETGTSGACIEKRVQAAAKAGAKIYVSLHLNSGSASANGAEIIIPNSSWKPELSTQGKELAQKILDELAAVGLNKRPTPIYSKDTTVGEKYPDGSISDYFAVQIYAKEKGIPGIIVEHAFLSNANDVNKFLKTEAGLKKLGVADATGIAKYLGLSKGQWVQVGDKWKYQENGKYVVSQWMTISGKRYYFDKEGYRVTGWQDISGKRYYFMPEGYMWTGWGSFGNTKYYFMPEGYMWTGWGSFGSRKYYFDKDGKMVTGEQTIDGKKYYFGDDGVLQSSEKSGWEERNGKRYYYEEGKMVTGWQDIDGERYYFMPEGYMWTGWGSFGNTKYYFDKEGKMVTGWQDISGKRYYFMPEGYMWTGWGSFGNTKYYFMPEGYMWTGWGSFGSRKYYFDKDGKMVTGEQTIDGKKYYFGDDGVLQSSEKSGWEERNGKKYYYEKGKMVIGWKDIAGKKYYFMPEGYMWTGWGSFGRTKYYFDQNGIMQVDWTKIDGKWFYFDKNGAYISSPSEKSPLSPQYTIEGISSVSAANLASYFKRKGATYPTFYKNSDAPTLEKFCQIYVEEAKAENIKVEVAFMQSMLETGWLKFGGAVQISQYNFAGIGALDGGAQGASFKSVREGVRAQIQHLKAYANKQPLNNPQVDPRFHLVKRGTAKYVEWLGQKENPDGLGWATGKSYGYKIIRLIKEL